jgi:hypothetical protein
VTSGTYLDKRLDKQEQPNVIVHLFIRTLVQLKIVHEYAKYPYVNDKGRVGHYSLYSSKVGGHLRLKWKRQGWYKFQSKSGKGNK